jgi:ERCC4-type nuclease
MTVPILIDSRVGSKELERYFLDMEHDLVHLDYGDVAFAGRGPDGCPWQIGIERKTIGDLCSCIQDGRLSGHQLPGLLATYNFVYLLVEGIAKCDLSNGLVKVQRGKAWVPVTLGDSKREFTVNEVMGYLNTLTVMTNVRIWQTNDLRETAAYVRWLHHWWNAKDFDAHRSHLATERSIQLVPTSLKRRVAAQLPGIGWERSKQVADHFADVSHMINAGMDEWTAVKWATDKGRNQGIGKTIAERIVKAVRGL